MAKRRPDSLVLLCALPPEAVAARLGIGRSRRRASRPAGHSRVRLTGMGPLKARQAASRLASSLPDGVPVVVVGVGGALVKGFEAGDLVVASAFGTANEGPGGGLQVVLPPTPLDERSRDLAQRLREALAERFASPPPLRSSRPAGPLAGRSERCSVVPAR